MKTLYATLFILFAGYLSAQISLSSSLTACYALNGNANEPINTLNGTVSAVTPTVNRFSQANSAMAFSGSPSSFIQLPNNPLIKPTGVSFSCWVKTNVTNSHQTIVYTNNTCTSFFEGYHLLFLNQGTNNYRFQIVKATAVCSSFGQSMVTSTASVVSNTWYHVGFYLGGDSIKLYINGVLSGAIANSNPITYANKNVFLGGTNEFTNYPLNGSMDNVRFYNRKLTGTEFNQLYTLDPICQPQPVASFSMSTNNLCVSQPLLLSSTSTNSPTTYAWTMSGGTPSVSTVANPTVSYASAGVYTISLIAANGFGSSSPVTQTVNVSTCIGIDETTNGKSVTLYPNPAKNELYVSGLEKGTEITLFNMLGELVYKGRVESDIEKINLTTQSPGLYIMRFVSQGKMITTKVIKE